MSRITTRGRVRLPRARHARWKGSPSVRSDRRRVRRLALGFVSLLHPVPLRCGLRDLDLQILRELDGSTYCLPGQAEVHDRLGDAYPAEVLLEGGVERLEVFFPADQRRP